MFLLGVWRWVGSKGGRALKSVLVSSAQGARFSNGFGSF